MKTSRLDGVSTAYKGLLNWPITKLMRLRRQKKYQLDKRKARQELEIPIDGYGRREANKWFRSLKSRTPVMLAVLRFAQNHPLDKNHAMPVFVALEELLLKRPRTRYPLNVALGGAVKEGVAFMEDGETKAPQEIVRLVRRKPKGRDDVETCCITIETFFGEDVVWSLTKDPSLSRKP